MASDLQHSIFIEKAGNRQDNIGIAPLLCCFTIASAMTRLWLENWSFNLKMSRVFKSSVGEGACYQVWQPEFDPWNSDGTRKELSSDFICSLDTHVSIHIHNTYSRGNKF